MTLDEILVAKAEDSGLFSDRLALLCEVEGLATAIRIREAVWGSNAELIELRIRTEAVRLVVLAQVRALRPPTTSDPVGIFH